MLLKYPRGWRRFKAMILRLIFLLACSLPLLGKSPNVLVFLSDDQGWGDLSSSGNGDLATPSIDSLARDGASFERFFVCAVCSPTRAEFLTGRHHARSGVYSTSSGGERMNLDEVTVADHFKAAGYRTGAFGKWHNGMQYPYHPNGRGFGEFYGFCSGHWGNYFDPLLEHNGRIVKGEGFCTDDFTNKAMSFIDKSVKEGKPFFAYVPYNTPHSPMQVPEEFWKKFAKKELKFSNQQQKESKKADNHKRCALAMCENLDWNVGRMLKQLEELKVADDTIVVWFHDNGPNGVRWNGGMKGRKGSTDEGGVRSPLYLRWKNGVKAGSKIPQISSVQDLLPTLCDLAGVSREKSKPLDGESLKPLLLGEKVEAVDRVLVNQWKDKISVRTQQFRLDQKGKLYDMKSDPEQRTPLHDKPKLVKRLSEVAKAHRGEFMPNYYSDKRSFAIAHPESIMTQLPARDGKAHGGIKRSNRFPNCSYFTNWTSKDDKITFDVEVLATGKHKVTLYYAAKEAGAKCELSYKEARLPLEISEAHDVPATGAEHDRSPRMESYVKDFKATSIGEIELEKGTGTLTLRAMEIPGPEAMEFRLLTLERVD